MNELLEKKPEWDKEARQVWDQLIAGKIPTFAAGQVLNRSLLDFYLVPSLANPSEVDIRKRHIVFAYNGARLPVALPQPKTLAIDLAAIITLSRLGLLEKTLSRYEVVVPHSTLGWLFQERQRATFHQPSRIEDATALKQLIANRTLRVVRLATSQDHRLVRQVGAELAAMLSAAREKSEAGTRTLVVCSSPLHRLGTVLGEDADVTGYEASICSCGAVIDRLKIRGALTQSEEQKARDYLKLHERPWPNEPAIDDQTELYLDRLSVTYLQAIDALGKLKAANVTAYITESEDKEANSLLELESLGKLQLAHIEQIRSALAAGIASGRVRAARSTTAAEDDQLFRLHPTYGTLGLVDAADAIVVDDRFINQHPTVTAKGRTNPILSSLDVLNLLFAARELTADELFAHRTVLRQFGYQLITLADDELLYHLKNASVADGKLLETAELRAIRKSLLRARMAKIVQLPGEANFLHRTLGAYSRAIKTTWETLPDRTEAKARADYLLEQVDIRNWASSAAQGNERSFLLQAYATYALQIASPPLNADKALKDAYYEWITDRLINTIKENQPEIYEWMVAHSRDIAVSGADNATLEYMKNVPMTDRELIRRAMLAACLEWIPPMIRNEVLSDSTLRSEFNLQIDFVISLSVPDVAFKMSELLDAVRKAGSAPGRSRKIADQAGIDWEVVANRQKGEMELTIRSASRILHAQNLLLFTRSKNVRASFFAHEAERLNLPIDVTKRYRKVLDKRPLSEDEFRDLMADGSHTPAAVSAMIMESLAKKNISLEVLVPRSLDYYERLVGHIEAQSNIKEYIDEVAVEHIRKQLAWRRHDGLRQALLMGSYSLISNVIANEHISATEFNELVKWGLEADPISRGILLELALKRSVDQTEIGPDVRVLAARFCGQGENGSYDPFAVLSAAFVMVDGELGRARVLVSKPPFWRRLASLAQAALITRCVLTIAGDLSKFVDWMQSVRWTVFGMQCYVDLRTEPRWLSDFATPQQLKDEIGGRVLFAAANDEKAADELGLRDILISDAPQSLKAQLNIALTMLPGPLEGNIDPIRPLQTEQIERMRNRLADASPTVSSFAPVANAAFVFKLPEDIPNLAANAIRRAQYRLDSDGKPHKLENCLVGLAVAAAVNRSHALADELFTVVRSYRRFSRDQLDLDAAFRIGIIACASRSDLREWCQCVGALIADLGFGELSREEAASLYPSVVGLCDLVPELWSACGQGIAAIEAVGFS